ncbi:ferritin-like domain-containing protein [Isoalcanivorax beigongshangi]|uniref:Ferritin-like domain-containing protein n=1 Tax=Isoalcanivorax beigongshangi TaxID=3238810 RepID=A0ABV4AHD9_9GAMM
MASIDLEKMLVKIKESQWALADIDWDAPGAERITPEQWPKLKAFMADLMWIEHVGARGFAAMAKKAPDDTLREIYTYFHAEEQRHANAEMALMKRWGMLEDGEALPEPNINLRLVIEWLDRYADKMPLYVLGAVIPMLEIALDGALCKFLLDTVDDPVCHEAFEKINGDESRHLGVGFSVMEMTGYNKSFIKVMQMVLPLVDPRLLLGIAAYMPLLNKMRDNIVEMGLSEQKLYEVMNKFERIGGRTADGRRNPWFQIIKHHARLVVDRGNKIYHVPVDAAVKITGLIPARLLPAVPSWVHELTWKPTA